MTQEEFIEYTGFQVELDKISETFRRSHQQRQGLLQRWEGILEQMHRKDHQIDEIFLGKLNQSIQSN